jgi:hypothetical protein
MHDEATKHLAEMAPLLGGYFAACALPGLFFGGRLLAQRRNRKSALCRDPILFGWTPAALFLLLAMLSFAGVPPTLPESFKDAVDALLGPVTLFVGTFAALTAAYLGRGYATRPAVGLTLLHIGFLFFGLAMTDRQFAEQVARPDNVPIVVMFFLLAGFTWWALARAVENDRRLEQGLAPRESEYGERTSTWPEVVYLELIGLLIATSLLIVWSIVLKAPLEDPANPALTPNPAKAPWYFLGLQELLVYFDPWMAGVVVPVLIIVGLCAIPYLDFNPRGNGYFSIQTRPLAVPLFLFGFFMLWMLPILIGTFLRGPNWSFFGPFAVHDSGVLPDYENVKLSEWFWGHLVGRSISEPSGTDEASRPIAGILLRESPGILLLLIYYVGVPALLLRTRWNNLRREMGFFGYASLMLLLMTMFLIPLKMLLRWMFDLSYVVSIPTWNLHL